MHLSSQQLQQRQLQQRRHCSASSRRSSAACRCSSGIGSNGSNGSSAVPSLARVGRYAGRGATLSLRAAGGGGGPSAEEAAALAATTALAPTETEKAAATAAPSTTNGAPLQQQQQHHGNGAGDAAVADAAGSTGSATPWYGVVSLAAMAALICSIDRAAISVAILPMAEEYGWSDSVKGAVNSAFYAGERLVFVCFSGRVVCFVCGCVCKGFRRVGSEAATDTNARHHPPNE